MQFGQVSVPYIVTPLAFRHSAKAARGAIRREAVSFGHSTKTIVITTAAATIRNSIFLSFMHDA